MKHTVYSLRKAGHKVRVIHSRFADVDFYTGGFHVEGIVFAPMQNVRNLVNTLDAQIRARDGETVVQVSFNDGQVADAVCVQIGNFSTKRGVAECLARIFEVTGRDPNQPRQYPMLKSLIDTEWGELVVLFTSPKSGTVVHATEIFQGRIGESHNLWEPTSFQETPESNKIVLRNE